MIRSGQAEEPMNTWNNKQAKLRVTYALDVSFISTTITTAISAQHQHTFQSKHIATTFTCTLASISDITSVLAIETSSYPHNFLLLLKHSHHCTGGKLMALQVPTPLNKDIDYTPSQTLNPSYTEPELPCGWGGVKR
uniref:Uncharacterized protein n=1 Tax=Guillardia theta TaxID=55529 RepID=A0A7S4P697_GUITH|mmetsp:Transcript_43974/g.138797  ORF Transcript_43974/g.138797 Transcript_43974/m.138797 type:complete len:137 (+) Transcript_43974:297-707(+)